MDYELRVIVEKVSISSQDVVKRDIVKIYDVNYYHRQIIDKTCVLFAVDDDL